MMSKIRLYWYRNLLNLINLRGRNVIKSQWPSRGGMGNRLKIARTRFKTIIKDKSCGTKGDVKTSGKNRRVIPKRNAKIRLDAGPAIATLAGPYFLSRRFSGT